MSATRDKDTKVRFVFSNLYESFRKGREAARNADLGEAAAGESPRRDAEVSEGTSPGLTTTREFRRVLQAGQTRPAMNLRPGWTVRPEWAIREYRAVEFLKNRRETREPAPAVESPRVIQARRSNPVLPSAANVARLQAALAGSARTAPVVALELQHRRLEGIQKRLSFLIREIESLSKGPRRNDDQE